MKNSFSWNNLRKSFLALAPMAGISDSPFREVCCDYGADLVFTEFVHIRGIVQGNNKSLDLLKYRTEERPIIAQIFGKEPEFFYKSAKIIEDLGFDGVDINMGCPARKVKEHGSGSALMKDVLLAKEIVVATKEATKIPVSVKTRIGISRYDGPQFVKELVDSGAEAITIHGRTVAQKFGGVVDYEAIADIVNSLNVPVIGNGDIVDINSYNSMINTGCVGVMIGRGSLGTPWIFNSIKNLSDYSPNLTDLKQCIIKHASLINDEEENNFLPFRKHLAWYIRGLPNAKIIRNGLVKINTFSDIIYLLDTIQQGE